MIVEELQPFIDSNYRTRKEAEHTGLGGSSLGGLASLYLALKYRDVFGRVAVVSPSVWFANNHIVNYVATLPKSTKVRIWLDIGTNEGKDSMDSAGAQKAVADVRLLRQALISKGWKDENLRYFEAQGAEHNEKAWATRVPEILTFLFPRKDVR
jgi:predicted alpha/beta superfamily hydrolase